MAKKKASKSDFIRSLPKELPAADVIAKGKDAGLSISKALVYIVRTGWKAKTKRGTGKVSPSKASATPAAPAASGSAPAATGKMSASDFIRSQPASMTARAVTDAAVKNGYSFKAPYVYAIRRNQQKRASPRSKAPASAPKAASHATAPQVHHATGAQHTSKQAMRALMIEVGVAAFDALAAEVLRELKGSGQ